MICQLTTLIQYIVPDGLFLASLKYAISPHVGNKSALQNTPLSIYIVFHFNKQSINFLYLTTNILLGGDFNFHGIFYNVLSF